MVTVKFMMLVLLMLVILCCAAVAAVPHQGCVTHEDCPNGSYCKPYGLARMGLCVSH